MNKNKSSTEELDIDLLLQSASEIVVAYVGNNSVPVDDVPGLIRTVFDTLSNLSEHNHFIDGDLEPAVPVHRSVTPDYIICLEDGKKLKMLKRYLRSQYAMTPEEYRTKWGLPSDYPMVAPNYAAERSKLAKKIGLGRGAAPRTRR